MYDLLVSKKGHIYICGDVRMAEEVTNTIEAGLQREGNMNLEDAKLFINEMKENQRFHEDIFGNSFNNFNVECKNCPDEI
jgi:sulfite reductase alpha subunit-like flavoprotein